jgi:hypothetical protein
MLLLAGACRSGDARGTAIFLQQIDRLLEQFICLRIVIFYFLHKECVSLVKLLLEVRHLLSFSFRLRVSVHTFVYFFKYQPMLASVQHNLCDIFSMQKCEFFKEVGTARIVKN